MFKNLAQLKVDENHYDFYNDFDCLKVLFENHLLTFFFKNSLNNYDVYLTFYNLELVRFNFGNFRKIESLILDTLYRGRFETENGLLEFSGNGKSYLYFDFIDGLSGEFFSDEFILNDKNEFK